MHALSGLDTGEVEIIYKPYIPYRGLVWIYVYLHMLQFLALDFSSFFIIYHKLKRQQK